MLSALNKGKKYALLAPVQNLWQTFIVFTVLYTEFCSMVAGGYIHHAPTTAPASSSRDAVRSYGELLRDYQAAFKMEPPSHIWPPAGESRNGTLYAEANLPVGSRA